MHNELLISMDAQRIPWMKEGDWGYRN